MTRLLNRTLFPLVLSFGLCSFVFSVVLCMGTAQAELISYYSFDADTLSSGAYANLVSGAPGATEATTGATLPTNILDGAENEAVRFDGSSNYLNTTSLGLPNNSQGLSAGSVSFWVRSDPGTASQQGILGTLNDGFNTAFTVDFGDGPAGSFRAFTRSEGNNDAGPNSDSNLPWNDGEWHHLAATWNQNSFGDNQIYFDGEPVPSIQRVAFGGIYAPYQYDMTIGALNSRGTPIRYLDGALDELRVYDHILSPEDVLSLSGAPITTLTVDRSTGELTLTNSSTKPVAMIGYSLLSDGETLNPNNWTSIADNYDVDNPGANQVDPDDKWIKLSDLSDEGDLSEAELGGVLGVHDGATLGVGQSISLGVGAWELGSVEDLTMTLLLPDGEVVDVVEKYINQFPDARFDEDTDVDGADFLAWQRGFGITSGATQAQGDANGDGAVDQLDLAIWQQQFGETVPLSSPRAIPEPFSGTLFSLFATAFTLGIRRKHEDPGCAC